MKYIIELVIILMVGFIGYMVSRYYLDFERGSDESIAISILVAFAYILGHYETAIVKWALKKDKSK